MVIEVLCATVPTPSPEIASTPMSTNYSGDDSLAVPSNYSHTIPNSKRTGVNFAPTSSQGNDMVGVPSESVVSTTPPSSFPSLFSVGEADYVPEDFNQTDLAPERPELEDNFATTSQNI